MREGEGRGGGVVTATQGKLVTGKGGERRRVMGSYKKRRGRIRRDGERQGGVGKGREKKEKDGKRWGRENEG